VTFAGVRYAGRDGSFLTRRWREMDSKHRFPVGDGIFRAPLLLALPAQRVQLGEPPLVAGAPCGDAIAQPILLHRDLAAELALLAV
jgi:hypothetical protein